jgi:polyhydroxyalkanoate synthesis regulator phasin
MNRGAGAATALPAPGPHSDLSSDVNMVEKPQPNEATPAPTPEAPPAAAVPRRPPGHRGADMRDTVAELAERAQLISQEAGSKVAAAMKDVISAAAGIAGFAIESARDLVQYMVKRGQMTPEEGDKLMREVEAAHDKRPASEKAKPTATKIAAEKAAIAKAEAAARAAAFAASQPPFRPPVRPPTPVASAPPVPVKLPAKPEAKATPAKPAPAKAAAPKAPPSKPAAKTAQAPAKSAKPAKPAAKAPAKATKPAKQPAKPAPKGKR